MQTYSSVSCKHSHLHVETVQGRRDKFGSRRVRVFTGKRQLLPFYPPVPLCSIQGASSPRGVAGAGQGQGCGCHLGWRVGFWGRERCCSQPTPAGDGPAGQLRDPRCAAGLAAGRTREVLGGCSCFLRKESRG